MDSVIKAYEDIQSWLWVVFLNAHGDNLTKGYN